jgi:hypothetical protein
VVYSAPLWAAGDYFSRVKESWLPYYGEALRSSRLEMVRSACRYDLGLVPFYVDRGLYFQAFDR